MLSCRVALPTAIAVEESHCISRWGPSFRPEYVALARVPALFPGVPLAAFTATADEATRRDIAGKLLNGSRPGRTFVTGFDRPNISLTVEQRRDGPRQLLDFVAPRPGESGTVYCPIGRASWWERGGQYGWISGVAVALTKKK